MVVTDHLVASEEIARLGWYRRGGVMRSTKLTGLAQELRIGLINPCQAQD